MSLTKILACISKFLNQFWKAFDIISLNNFLVPILYFFWGTITCMLNNLILSLILWRAGYSFSFFLLLFNYSCPTFTPIALRCLAHPPKSIPTLLSIPMGPLYMFLDLLLPFLPPVFSLFFLVFRLDNFHMYMCVLILYVWYSKIYILNVMIFICTFF